MAIKRFGNETRITSGTPDVHGWQRGSSNHQCDNGRVRETRAEPVRPE